ncbi:hypothetical protein Tco_0311997, partial [Tanacetum coccineum]
MGRDTIQLEDAISTISQEYLLEFTFEYGIPKSLHPELPGLEDTIVDFLEGKVGYVRFDNQSIERDRLIGIGFVLDFVEFISFTFSDKKIIFSDNKLFVLVYVEAAKHQ